MLLHVASLLVALRATHEHQTIVKTGCHDVCRVVLVARAYNARDVICVMIFNDHRLMMVILTSFIVAERTSVLGLTSSTVAD